MNRITLGADPELFMVDAAGGLISAIGRIGGSKDNPKELAELGKGFAVQEDNVAVEFNIPPSESKLQFRTNINRVMSYLSDLVAQQGLMFVNLSAKEFPADQLDNPKAQEFGCDPDFDAWNKGQPNPRPHAKNKALRSAGGHVHVGGVDIRSMREACRLVKFMDLYLGVPSTIQDNGDLRKQLYGKRGAFRPKPYGIEYRTLSNYWVFEDKTIDWVHDATLRAIQMWEENTINIDDDDALIEQAINYNNKDIAYKLLDKYALKLA